MRIIDLRSDTVTRPTPAMRAAIAEAEVGDDVYGEDPTVNRLEARAATLLGKEAAVFVSSGTQGNLLGIVSHCDRGDELIVGQQAHAYTHEGGGAAMLGGIQSQPIRFEADGTLDLAQVEAAIKPVDDHYVRTRLLCLENTQAGKVLPLDYLRAAADLARRRELRLHLDGARVFNAAVKLEVPVGEVARHFDSVSFCLSKGLGAPAGSMLCGSAELVRKARRYRQIVGGGMRQVGILAAAGLVALDHHVDRLAEDHRNAALLADALARVDGVAVDPSTVQTNMVMVSVDEAVAPALREHLAGRGIIVRRGARLRLVTHMDVSADDMRTVAGAFEAFLVSPKQRVGAQA